MPKGKKNNALSQHGFFNKVPVFGFARSFASGLAICDAKIIILEDETLQHQTDHEGKFGPIMWEVGMPITLRLEKPGTWWSGYHTTQTATLIVPPEGINNPNYLLNVSFQVPSKMAFSFISWGMGMAANPETGQIAVTVTPPNITLDHIPQGEPDVEVSLEPNPGVRPFYLGLFPGIHKTKFWGCRELRTTTHDGGVIFPNVPPGDYTLTAKKGEKVSDTIKVTVHPGVIVNASPPVGLII